MRTRSDETTPSKSRNSLDLGLYTARETAAALRCSVRTLRRWCSEGRLTPLRTSANGGGKLLFSEREIQRLVAELEGRDVA